MVLGQQMPYFLQTTGHMIEYGLRVCLRQLLPQPRQARTRALPARASVQLHIPRQRLQQRGFTGAVAAEQADLLLAQHRQMHILQYYLSTKMQGCGFEAEQRHGKETLWLEVGTGGILRQPQRKNFAATGTLAL